MSETSNKKPIIILIVCGIVAVLIFVVGVGFGDGGSTGNQSWQEDLKGFGPSSNLKPGDLEVAAGDCTITPTRIDVPSGCTIAVAPFGGGFDIGSAVKQVTVTAIESSVTLDLFVQGTEVSQDLDPGDEPLLLTFGTDGGRLSLTCGGILADPCAVGLS